MYQLKAKLINVGSEVRWESSSYFYIKKYSKKLLLLKLRIYLI